MNEQVKRKTNRENAHALYSTKSCEIEQILYIAVLPLTFMSNG